MPPVSWPLPRLASLVLGLLAPVPSWAQTATERQAGSAGRELTQQQSEAINRWIESKGDKANLERAQRQAEAVYRWIKLNGDSAAVSTPRSAPAHNPRGASATPRAPALSPGAAANARPRSGTGPAADANTSADSNPSPDRSSVDQRLVVTPMPTSAAPVGTESVAALSEKVESAQPSAAVERAADAPTVPPHLAATQLGSTPSVAPPPEPEERPIRQIARVEPVFPPQLRDNLRSGSAQLRFTIEPNGTVSRVTPIKATHVRLSMAAVEAVRQWRFEPLLQAREVAIEIVFKDQ